MRPLALALLCLLACQQVAAQTAKAREKTPAPCRVSGRVVAALDGAPLKSSRVVLMQEGVASHPKVFGATTDTDGFFEIKNVAAGRYRFIASRIGYVNREYQAQSTEQGVVLSLQPGEDFREALFRLIRAGVITGRILDENGEPLDNVVVTALRKPTSSELEEEGPRRSHKEELVTSATATTDDRGDYRLFGLKPGDYYVKAAEPAQMFSPFANEGSATERVVQEALGSEYVPLYSPGVVAFDQAQPVAVRAGEEVAADFNMRHVISVEVAGKVIGPDGRPSTHAWVDLEQAAVSEDTFGEFTSNTNNDGEFSLKNVPPGTYLLTASQFEMGEDKEWRAHQKIEVGERKIDSLVLALGRGNQIKGRISFSGPGSAPDAARVFLSLAPVGDDDVDTGGWATVKKDGSFEFLDVPDGSYELKIHDRDPAWYVRSARFGADDVLEKGLQIEKGEGGGTLEIVMSSPGAQLAGVVTQKDKPVVGVQVRVRPDPETPFNHLRSKSTATDQNGKFSLANLAPGKYQVTVKSTEESGAVSATVEPKSITLRESDRQSVELTLPEPKP